MVCKIAKIVISRCCMFVQKKPRGIIMDKLENFGYYHSILMFSKKIFGHIRWKVDDTMICSKIMSS